MTEKFDCGKDNLASKYTYPSGKTATYSYDSILRRNRTVINTTTPIDHQYVYCQTAETIRAPRRLAGSISANISMVTPMTPTEILLRSRAATRPQRRHIPNSSGSLMTN